MNVGMSYTLSLLSNITSTYTFTCIGISTFTQKQEYHLSVTTVARKHQGSPQILQKLKNIDTTTYQSYTFMLVQPSY